MTLSRRTMGMATMIRLLRLLLLLPAIATSFQIQRPCPRFRTVLFEVDDESNNAKRLWNPFQEVADILSNWDDVMDDFMNKRMGNGEVFYGKRKFKPSNRPNTEGRYNGMGLSDKMRIDIARETKEEFLERKRKQRTDEK